MVEKTVKPYTQEGSKKSQVSNMFDKIAPYYDFLNRFLSLGIDVTWRKKAIKKIKNKQADLILDVATGTADVALEIVNQLQPKKVIGLDISKEMLEIGKKKIAKKVPIKKKVNKKTAAKKASAKKKVAKKKKR